MSEVDEPVTTADKHAAEHLVCAGAYGPSLNLTVMLMRRLRGSFGSLVL